MNESNYMVCEYCKTCKLVRQIHKCVNDVMFYVTSVTGANSFLQPRQDASGCVQRHKYEKYFLVFLNSPFQPKHIPEQVKVALKGVKVIL
jgi:hypothetical protein